MKKYWKLVVAVGAFVVFMVVVGVVYQNLSEEYKPQQNLVTQNTESPQKEAADGTDAGIGESTVNGSFEENATVDSLSQNGTTGQQGMNGEVSREGAEENDTSAGSEKSEGRKGADTDETNDAMAIDFTVENAAGKEVTLYSFIGKPIVLNFWASWCRPCKMELPDFQAAYEKYDGEIEFVMVNLTDGIQETKESATQFIEGEGYTLPFYFDTTQEAAYTYGIYSLPMTFFINAEGEIIAYAQGMIDAETLEKGISMIYP